MCHDNYCSYCDLLFIIFTFGKTKMDKNRIQGIFEKNLLEEKVTTADINVQVYTRNIRLNVKDPFTYKCNICEVNDIEGQQALFEHNKLTDHFNKLKELSSAHGIEKKITELKNVNPINLEEFSDRIFDSASLLTVEKAIETLEKVYHYYEKCPEKHPSYQNDWTEFYQRRKRELLAEFRGVETHDFTNEWTIYWDILRKQYYKKSVAESIDYIIENYTTNNNKGPSSSATLESLESGELPESPKRKKHHRRRSKSRKRHTSRKRSHSHHRRRVSPSSRASGTPSDRSSSIDRRRRPRQRKQSKSPVGKRHRTGRRSRSRAHRRISSENSTSVGRSSSSNERRHRLRSRSRSPGMRRSLQRTRSRMRWSSPKHFTGTISDRSTSIERRRRTRSRSISPFDGRLRRRERSRNRNNMYSPDDLRFSIEKRRQQRENSFRDRPRDRSMIRKDKRTSPRISSDCSSSIEQRKSASPIVKQFLAKDRPATCANQCTLPKNAPISNVDPSDSGQFSSDAHTSVTVNKNLPKGKWKPLPFLDDKKGKAKVPEIPTKTTANGCWPQQSILKDKNVDIAAAKTIPIKSVPPNSKSAELTSPLTPPIPAIQSIKSILKKPSTSREAQFAKANKLMNPSNCKMQQFYDKSKLKSIVEASKRILKTSSSTDAIDADSDSALDSALVTSQIQGMLEFISIDPTSMADKHILTLMCNYMNIMSNDKYIGTIKSSEKNVDDNNDVVLVKTSTKPSPPNGVANGVVNSLKSDNSPSTNQTVSTSYSINRSRIDRIALLNDIVDVKPNDQPSTSVALKPNPRDPRLRTNREQKVDCLDVIPMDIECSGSSTEMDDDDCQYVGTFPNDRF